MGCFPCFGSSRNNPATSTGRSEREEKKVEKAIREAAKRNDMGSAKALAKEVVQSRKAVNRLYGNKAQLKYYGAKAPGGGNGGSGRGAASSSSSAAAGGGGGQAETA